MTKWMSDKYFLSQNVYIRLSFARNHSQSKIYMQNDHNTAAKNKKLLFTKRLPWINILTLI